MPVTTVAPVPKPPSHTRATTPTGSRKRPAPHEAEAQPGAPDGHAQHGEPAGHEDHGHEDHGEERVVQLSEAELQEFGIRVGTAGPGPLQRHLSLPGEVTLNADRVAHVVPRVPSIVREVHNTLGEQVRAGDIMAMLDSRELANAQSAYLAATERAALAQTTFQPRPTCGSRKLPRNRSTSAPNRPWPKPGSHSARRSKSCTRWV